MRTRTSPARDGRALLAALAAAGSLLVASCTSQESIEERRSRALSAQAEEIPSETLAVPEGARTSEQPRAASQAASQEVSLVQARGARDASAALTGDAWRNVRNAELASGDASARQGANGGGQDAGDLPALDDEPVIRPRASAPRAAPRADAGRAAGGSSAADVLNALREDLDAEKAEAAYYAEKGDQAMASGRYDEAEEHFKRAVAADPGNEDLVKKLHNAEFQLGKRAGDVSVIADKVRLEIEVERQQRLAEIDGNLENARKALAANAVEDAEKFASLAVEKINLNPQEAGEERARAARSLLDEVRKSRRELEAARQEARIQTSQEIADQELALEDERRRAHVQDLLRKTLDAIRRREYRKVGELCDSVLEAEPSNKVAAYWKRTADERLLKERQLKIIRERIDNRDKLSTNFIEATIPYGEIFVFPEDEYWMRVRQRREKLKPATLDDPAPVRATKNALESTTIEVSFEDSPLGDVVEHFRQVVGVNIVVDPSVDGDSIQITQSINRLPASNALRLILRSKDLGYTFRDNILVVTTIDEAKEPTEFEAYNVSDLLMKVRDFTAPELRLKSADEDTGGAPISFTDEFAEEGEELDPDNLIQVIQESSGGDTVWDGETNTINHQRGQLFVQATRELHQKVRDVLANLRQDSDLYVVVEARFIDITDDFLEDIGIDSRELSDRNWDQVVPFGGDLNDSSTGGNDLGIVQQGSATDNFLVGGLDRWAGRVQHIIDGFTGTISGERLTAGGGVGGGSFQATWLEPFQVNVILRAVQEKSDVRQLTAPVVTAHNNERVYVSVITQRAYIADYELVSGGTGFAIIEVADPVVQTFQEGVILDVNPTISHDKKYVTLDVKPTLATLIGGIISTINISLGSFTNVAFAVPIGIPQISLQQSYTSVTVPNGGTVLLGGFKGMREQKFQSYIPILGKIPILKNLARRKATLIEKRSLVILLTARIVDLRGEEERRFNAQ